MSAMDGGRKRLERAKQIARDIVTALDGNQRAAIAVVDRELDYRSHLTISPRELLDAIDSVEATDFPFQINALDALAQEGLFARKTLRGEAHERTAPEVVRDGDLVGTPERHELGERHLDDVADDLEN